MLTWSGLLTVGQLSQASPTPSPSPSLWSGLGTLLQLSTGFLIPAKQDKQTHQGNGANGRRSRISSGCNRWQKTPGQLNSCDKATV